MELILSGLVPANYSEDTWELMIHGTSRREEVEYLKLLTIVSAIISAGRMAAGAEAGDSLSQAFQNLRGALFPEIKAGLLAKAEKNVKILEDEFKKGPLKVKAREYSTTRRKKR